MMPALVVGSKCPKASATASTERWDSGARATSQQVAVHERIGGGNQVSEVD